MVHIITIGRADQRAPRGHKRLDRPFTNLTRLTTPGVNKRPPSRACQEISCEPVFGHSYTDPTTEMSYDQRQRPAKKIVAAFCSNLARKEIFIFSPSQWWDWRAIMGAYHHVGYREDSRSSLLHEASKEDSS
ncbi:hypothetical protein Pyn_00242 [Prunus yedoensis var. nudiflora]|uniref:Uncharacterized protein n=1 Tax=Prunus yedoensis var. nudiflora TaxID=2094558 RepID=A0A314Z5S9_PRUYE|nr:hypothetical protein Pyn_00242 [Prunus yedoensis var. nudiflora]